MIAKKLLVPVLAAVLALPLAAGCSGQQGDVQAGLEPIIEAYGLPHLPKVQGLVDLDPARTADKLSDFAYREVPVQGESEGAGEGEDATNAEGGTAGGAAGETADGAAGALEGQWAADAWAFDALDAYGDGTQGAASAVGEGCWVLELLAKDAEDPSEWRACTLEDIQAGTSPDSGRVTVLFANGFSSADALEAANFMNALFYCKTGAVALDGNGHIACAVAQNSSGGVCEFQQDGPCAIRLLFHPKPNWNGGSFDQLLEECHAQAETEGWNCSDFKKRAPLFKDPFIVLV